jgi:hypothetical protein
MRIQPSVKIEEWRRERFRRLATQIHHVSYRFCSDAATSELLDPSIYIEASNPLIEVYIVERLQLIELASKALTGGGDLLTRRAEDHGPILMVIVDDNGATIFNVPDPRIKENLQVWPWGDNDDAEGGQS